MADHATAVVHAVTTWLEKIYEPDTKVKIKPVNQMGNERRADFDQIVQKDADSLSNELETLKALYEKLRSGQLLEAQKELMKNGQAELYEWVSGGAPSFDNVSFTESDDFGSLVSNDVVMASQIQVACKSA